MKKLSCFVAGLLIISCFAAIGLVKEASGYGPLGSDDMEINLDFGQPNVKTVTIDGTTYVEFKVLTGASAHHYVPGAPILPIYTTTMSFPFGTEIVSIECLHDEVQTMGLSYKVVPSPQRVMPAIQDATSAEYIMDGEIYNSANLFPNNWFTYYTGGGLDENNEHKTFLTIRAYPVRYSPATDTLSYIEHLDLTITYQEPDSDLLTGNGEYDMVIITPSSFTGELQKLVNHKNSYGVDTLLKTTSEIYDLYSGVDNPEKIKYFIKDAIDTYDINYVLLVGGMKSLLWGTRRDDDNQGSADWHVPVRYTNLRDPGSVYDPGFISDLYYADVYDGEGEFSSWDSDKNGNSDGLFANWKFGASKDIIDLYPDVYVGRLACRNKYEVKIMVNKIINYEKEPAPSSWFNTMIGIGGDSHDDAGTDYIEGELACDHVFSTYMTEFTPVRLYASYKDTDPSHTPSPENIIREISAGAGHLLFEGHGNPGSWNTHWPGVFNWRNTPGGIDNFDFLKFKNKGKLPVCVVGGCHNSMFDVTLFSTIFDEPYTWCYGAPTPECWSWWMTRKINGGSIATMGNTGLGYGAVGEHGDQDGDGINLPDTLEAVGGYQIVQFYKTYDEETDILGECWGGAEKKYLDTYPGMEDQTDCKTVEQWPLLGDPSLKIGGYSSQSGLRAKISDAEAGVKGIVDEPAEFHGIGYSGISPYQYSWDFTDDGIDNYNDATGSTVTYIWDSPGVYWVSLKVKDNSNHEATYDTVICIEPSGQQPDEPDGPINVQIGETYTYETSVDTTGWDNVYYRFSWGDGTASNWVQTTSASHSWGEEGSYDIVAQTLLVKQTPDGEIVTFSDWSDTHTVNAGEDEPVTLDITKPKTGRLYASFTGDNGMPIIFFGDLIFYINQEVEVNVQSTGVDKVKFIVEEKSGDIFDSAEVVSQDNLYSYNFEKIGIGFYSIIAEAYLDDTLVTSKTLSTIFSLSPQ